MVEASAEVHQVMRMYSPRWKKMFVSSVCQCFRISLVSVSGFSESQVLLLKKCSTGWEKSFRLHLGFSQRSSEGFLHGFNWIIIQSENSAMSNYLSHACSPEPRCICRESPGTRTRWWSKRRRTDRWTDSSVECGTSGIFGWTSRFAGETRRSRHRRIHRWRRSCRRWLIPEGRTACPS